MSLEAGTRLGPYTIVAKLGAGGMGEVFRAHDSKLGRDVAIKILPTTLVADADRLGRFEREARALAAINQPNIASIYGFEDSVSEDGSSARRALVLELVEGETLANRLQRGQLPPAVALKLARQIALGLDAAHEKGVIHRDLKPANIMIRSDGLVKVLDFGLAKLSLPGPQHETATASGTEPGVVMGTAAYMSPEQARGEAVDKRTDVWAFGCVLYEMLTGRAPFARQTLADTVSAIVNDIPEWTRLPSSVPHAVATFLQHCLQKDRAHRWHDLGDATRILDDASAMPPPKTDVPGVASRSVIRTALPWTLAAVAVAIAATIALRPRPTAAPAPLVQFTISPPDGLSFGGARVSPAPAISPDGERLVFSAANAAGSRSLWLRKLSSLEATAIRGTSDSNVSFPFWSPNGRSIGFFADNELKTSDLDTGAVQVLCKAPGFQGGAWAADDTIVFGSLGQGLMRIPAGGGRAVPLTTLDADTAQKAGGHLQPSLLPDGRHVLFQSYPQRTIWIASLDGSAPVPLKSDAGAMQADSGAWYAPPGVLLFVRQNTLLAQRFDLDRLALDGAPVPIAENVLTPTFYGQPAFTVSSTGILAYRRLNPTNAVLTWYDRSGQAAPIKDSEADYAGLLSLLPDGKEVVASIGRDRQRDLWRINLETGRRTKLTSGAPSNSPQVSPDGLWVARASSKDGRQAIFRMPSSGAGPDEPWIVEDGSWPTHWSKRWVVFQKRQTTGQYDVGYVSVDDPANIRFYLADSGYSEYGGRLSPDERWMAYSSNETGGTNDVYLRPFPDPTGGKWPVSGAGGGGSPMWRETGTELFYVEETAGRLMSVAVKLDDRSVTLEEPKPWIQLDGLRSLPLTVTRDGQKALVAVPIAGTPSPLNVVMNWQTLMSSDR